MRTAINNPFRPGADTVPEVWAGRTHELNDWRDLVRPRLVSGLFERGRTFLGEPGLGKSALVRRITDSAAAAGDWVTPQLRVPAGADPLKLVAEALLRLADRAGLASRRERRISEMLGRIQSVAVSGVGLTMRESTGPDPYVSLTELLVELGTAAMNAGNVVVIHVDEIQNIDDQRALSQLLIAFGDAIGHEIVVDAPGEIPIRRGLPIAVYLTGLPDFEDRAGSRRGATFARRFKTEVLTGIPDDDLESALQPFVSPGWEILDGEGGTARIRMTQEAVHEIIDLCRGEPFLFQLAGERAWYAASDTTITREHVRAGWIGAKREAAAHVERILDQLPQRERDFLEAMAQLPASDRTMTRIADVAGFATAAAAGPTSQRLDTIRGVIARGTPYTFRHRAVEAYLTSGWPEPR